MSASFYQSTVPWIRSSSPDRSRILNSTYPWLDELHARWLAMPMLETGQLLCGNNYIDTLGNKKELYIRRRILELLYEFSDLGAQRYTHNHSGDEWNSNALRLAREAWIVSEHRSKEDLAILYIMIYVIGDRWRTTRDKQLTAQTFASYSNVSSSEQERDDSIDTYSRHLGSTSEATLASEGQQREEDCVYRECCLMYGPYFLQASISSKEKDVAFFTKAMSLGLRHLRCFEEGRTKEESGSLQALIVQRFCDMVGCNITEGWEEVFEFIDSMRMTPHMS